MTEKDKGKISINANPPGTLEIEEFKNRMTQHRQDAALKNKKNKCDGTCYPCFSARGVSLRQILWHDRGR